jgi:hypothetical protein
VSIEFSPPGVSYRTAGRNTRCHRLTPRPRFTTRGWPALGHWALSIRRNHLVVRRDGEPALALASCQLSRAPFACLFLFVSLQTVEKKVEDETLSV